MAPNCPGMWPVVDARAASRRYTVVGILSICCVYIRGGWKYGVLKINQQQFKDKNTESTKYRTILENYRKLRASGKM